ncbi:hypothetical protein COB18_00915 [Candidatus Kaiserbacteria bacterium]|nr:MAG: hypothetical protein COB18_00915 [Candidatus Kaiserbacteria bacterium]
MLEKLFTLFKVSVFTAVFITVGTLGYIFSFYTGDTQDTRYDCAVVFGAAVWPGGIPSHALADRTHEAIDRYVDGQVSCLVFSGADSVYGKHEVDVMIDIADEREVTLEDIELDYEGGNTKKTIQNLNTDRSYLFVSNDFHLARISLLARQVGIEKFDVQKSEYRFGRYSRESFFVFRELVAFWYYAFVAV